MAYKNEAQVMDTVFTGRRTDEISFPLGGIGTGSIGLAGNGRLYDWEIWNRANKGSVNGFTHFAVKAQREGKLRNARVICGDIYKNLSGQYGLNFGHGLTNTSMQGFPHFRECSFRGEFPLAEISLTDPDALCSVKMKAFNPFIPQNGRDSSIPAAFFEITITNIAPVTLDFSVAGTLCNAEEQGHNRYVDNGAFRGIAMAGEVTDKDNPDFHQLLIATDQTDVSYQEYWYRGDQFDNLETFWRNFTEYERFVNRTYDTPGKRDHGTICACKTLKSGESCTLRFLIAWYNPTKPDQWMREGEQPMVVRNYYSYLFDNVQEVGDYCFKNWDRLLSATQQWHDELFSSTLPPEVIEAVSANLSVLKTETSIRLGENGDFYGWEGLGERYGSCPGTCTHVWNYAYAMAFLFPDIERGIRTNDYKYNQRPSGEMVFRTRIPFGRGIGPFRACVDGQLGGVIKVWREWKLSGDDEWLKSIWPEVKRSLEYAWSPENLDRWDADKDGVMEGRQHNTLDIELFGPSSWLEGFYLGALKAGAEMAQYLGETESAKEYLKLFENGKAWTAQQLFNGKYFIQKVDLTDKAMLDSYPEPELYKSPVLKSYWNAEAGQIKYQIGEGSSIDQLLAQWHADIIGLGELFDPKQVDIALQNMYKNNFKPSMRKHYNPWRLFAINDEAGAIIVDYPEGAVKPAIPVFYTQETMHGFEYAFAGLLIKHGYIEEGLSIVRGVRNRYRGDNRNPWNEIECGSNYARSMASYAMIPIFSGMRFDMTKNMLGFAPICRDGDFRCVWSAGKAFGNVMIGNTTKINVLTGEIKLGRLELPYLEKVSEVIIDGKPVDFTLEDGAVVFDPVDVKEFIEVK